MSKEGTPPKQGSFQAQVLPLYNCRGLVYIMSNTQTFPVCDAVNEDRTTIEPLKPLNLSADEEKRLIEILTNAKTATGIDIPVTSPATLKSGMKDSPGLTVATVSHGFSTDKFYIPTDPDQADKLAMRKNYKGQIDNSVKRNLFEGKGIVFDNLQENDKPLLERVFGSQIGFDKDQAMLYSEVSVRPGALRVLHGEAANIGIFGGLVGGALLLASTTGNAVNAAGVSTFTSLGVAGLGGAGLLVGARSAINEMRDRNNGDERAEMLEFVGRRLDGDTKPWVPRVLESSKINEISGPVVDQSLPKMDLPQKTMDMNALAGRVSSLFGSKENKKSFALSM